LGGRFVATDSAIVNQTSAPRWTRRIGDYFSISDRWAFESFGEYLSADVELHFANHPPIEGLDAMLGFAAQMKAAVKSVQHKLHSFHTDVEQRTVVVGLEVRYVRLDDGVREYPAAVVLGFDDDDLIDEYRVYVDLTGLL
jgi:ketosteroid isomerase-like protein